MGVVVFAGSFHGKSTAHRKKLGHDVEEPPPPHAINEEEWQEAFDNYEAVQDQWKKDRIPKDLAKRNKLFTVMCKVAYQSDVPVLFSHHSGELEAAAKSSGREVRFVLIEYLEMTDRIKAMTEEPPIFRMISAYGFAQGLARRQGNIVLYPTIEKAIASY